ncbi:MAG: hypothetical protein IRZ10_06405 [Thermoflavifilum sp.]|nr:hypothetical protein [Thermoflavifilum sp.]MCL6514037.1 hypothetical protein [Alicyclobacillus sp.]
MRIRNVAISALWVLAILMVLFSVFSWAGVVVRVPALVCLIIAVCLTALRRYARSLWWLWQAAHGQDQGVRVTTIRDDMSGLVLRVLFAYNPTFLGVQVTLDVLYGVAVLRPEFGVKVLS